MSEPEIFWPPRNRVPFRGCSNMDAIVVVVRRSVQATCRVSKRGGVATSFWCGISKASRVVG